MLPQEFRDLSESSDEYILPFPKVLEAIECWRLDNIGCLGWELILKFPNGCIGHPESVIGYSTHIADTESYDDFVERSSWDCKCSIEECVKVDRERYEEKNINVLFCVTPDTET